MKTILLSLLLSISLFGRLNPFETTEIFNEQRLSLLESLEKTKEIKKEKKIVKEKKQKIVKSKKQIEKKDIVKATSPKIVERFKVLPYVKIYVENNILTIKVDKKYPLINEEFLKEENKIFFDFKGKPSFYTIKKDVISEDFKSFAVGTHRKKNFFRVVVELSDSLINYKEKIDPISRVITIQKK
jgi:hypothetical protein